jgi:uncharacterized damage-inducible protein DinB
MSLERVIESWKEVRSGLIDEVSQIPAEQFSFRAAPDSRSVVELLQHVVETQKLLAGETARADSNIRRQSFADHIKEYAPEVASIQDKNGLMELLRASMETTEATIRAAASNLEGTMQRFDGKELSKIDFLNFAISHEMYHRGQLTVYERLLSIEPALTQRFRKLFSSPPKSSAAENAS